VLLDVYRGVLLAELAVVIGLYAWSLVKYLHGARNATEPVLRDLRFGQACRVVCVLTANLIFLLAVAERLGSPDAGRVFYNVLLQVLCIPAIVAWGKIDLPRFRRLTSEEQTMQALNALEAAEIAARTRVQQDPKMRELLADHQVSVMERESRRIE
jgi:hypothetical protein